MNDEETRDAMEHSWDERWLDEALTSYGMVSPRPGLEARILAHLETRALQRQRRWTFAFAAAAAVLLVALIANVGYRKTGTVQNAATGTHSSPSISVFPDTGNMVGVQSSKGNSRPVHDHPMTASRQKPRAGVTQTKLARDADSSRSEPEGVDVAEQKPSAQDMDQSDAEAPSSDIVAQEEPAPSPGQSNPAVAPAQERTMPEIRISGLNIKPIQIQEISPGKTTD